MEVLALIDKVRKFDGKLPGKLKNDQPLDAYNGKTRKYPFSIEFIKPRGGPAL